VFFLLMFRASCVPPANYLVIELSRADNPSSDFFFSMLARPGAIGDSYPPCRCRIQTSIVFSFYFSHVVRTVASSSYVVDGGR